MSNVNILDFLCESKQIEFDFREYAKPGDELAYLFEKWIPYYNMKYRICKSIQPKSILEIGVRYGYSAITFLNAAPEAKYIGIDNDSDTFGGAKGAINWAEQITQDYDAKFILGDSQLMDEFPELEQYDLIHIDGQQDGDGTYHDLELALHKAKWILVDGFHWSRENMLSSNFFIEKYKAFIEYALIIPGYAGELLIKVKQNYSIMKKNYQELQNTYDNNYYLGDCGGYDTFIKTNGRKLDERLKGVLALVNPIDDEKILDIGCGRGELSYALSLYGANVIGIDYSKEAIDIANNTYTDVIGEKLKYIRDDVLNINENCKFNKVVMADVFEHIEQEVLDRLLDKIGKLLAKDGKLIIHTAPNKLFYDIKYNNRVNEAKQLGSYLPKNPRTVYEDVMHINEQTVDSLKNNLAKSFKYIKVWTGETSELFKDAADLVNENFNHNEIYAICSNENILNQYIKTLGYKRLDTNDLNIAIDLESNINESIPFSDELAISITNNSKQVLISNNPYPVNISYHVLDTQYNAVIFDGIRTAIDFPIRPSTKELININISKHNLKQGTYIYRICLVQEAQFWFEDIMKNCFEDIYIVI